MESTSKWALFTEYKITGYISNGPYNFTQEKAKEILKCLRNNDTLEEMIQNKDVNKMWIQQEHTGKIIN